MSDYLVKTIAAKYGKTEKFVYSKLRKLWQKGGQRNALLPNYSKCGGKGKRRFSEAEIGNIHNNSKSSPKIPGESQGIGITQRIEKLLVKGMKKFYESEENYTLEKAYQKTLETYFNIV